jgi:tetratricopeptide (TPR) repeat protein
VRRYRDRSLALSRQTGASSAAARSLLQLATLCGLEGNWDEAAALVADAESMLDENVHRGPAAWAAEVLAHRDLTAGHPAMARDRLLHVYGSSGLAEEMVSTNLARAYLELGDVSRAEELAERAVGASRARADHVDMTWALEMWARVAFQQGDFLAARTRIEEGLALARSIPIPFAEGNLLYLFARLHVQQGEPGQARVRMSEARAIFQRLGARIDVERTNQFLAMPC